MFKYLTIFAICIYASMGQPLIQFSEQNIVDFGCTEIFLWKFEIILLDAFNAAKECSPKTLPIIEKLEEDVTLSIKKSFSMVLGGIIAFRECETYICKKAALLKIGKTLTENLTENANLVKDALVEIEASHPEATQCVSKAFTDALDALIKAGYEFILCLSS